jgi:hypothetical protein
VRKVLAACAVVLLVLLVSGCSVAQWQEVGMGVGDFTTTWTIGSCHRLDQPQETDPMFPSDTSPAVPCDSSHESETYAVVPITGALAAQPERPSPLWLQQALAGTCSWNAMLAYLGAQPIDALMNVSVLQVAPSEPEWQRGVRKLRCDALIGPRTSAGVSSVARPLHDILRVPAGDEFRVCQVYGQEVGCDRPHDSELINAWTKFRAGRASSRTKAVETAQVLSFCRPKAQTFLGGKLTSRPGVALYAGVPQEALTPGSMVLGQCLLGDAHRDRLWTGSLRSGVRRLP